MSRTGRLFQLMDALRGNRSPVTAAAPVHGSAGVGYLLRSGFFLLTAARLGIRLDEVVIGLMREDDRRRLREVNPNGKAPLRNHLASREWISGNSGKARPPLAQYAHRMAGFQRAQALPAWQRTHAGW